MKISKKTLLFWGFWLLLAVAVYAWLFSSGWFKDLTVGNEAMSRLQNTLQEETDILQAGIQHRQYFAVAGEVQENHTELIISALVDKSCEDDESYCLQLWRQIAEIVLKQYEAVQEVDLLTISLVQQTRVLFVAFSTTESQTFSIEEWGEILAQEEVSQ